MCVYCVYLPCTDSQWSLQIPGCPSKKSRGVTPASWPNLPIGLWSSWPPNHLQTLIGFIVSSPPVSWCVVGVLAHYGCRRIIQVDAAHWWWMRRFPPFYVKRFECLEKRYINVTNYYDYLFIMCIYTHTHVYLWKIYMYIHLYYNSFIFIYK